MDSQLVQRTRYLLKSRVKYAQTCPFYLFQSACLQLLNWLEQHPIFSGILHGLRCEQEPFLAPLQATVRHVEELNASNKRLERPFLIASSRREQAALCYSVVSCVAHASLTKPEFESTQYNSQYRTVFLMRQLTVHLQGQGIQDEDKALDLVRDVAVSGIYEYLDEQLDARNALIGLLFKYKHRSEWFRRKRLREIADHGLENKPKGGERALAIDLYEYVYDQGVEYSIEATSASGEADLVARDSDGRHIIIDAKYIAQADYPSEVKRKIADGFHQVARYCEDYHEPIGYLVVYINHKKHPRMPLEEIDGFRFLSVRGKNVYYIPVEIGDDVSASKSGVSEEIPILREDLLNEVVPPTAPVSPG